MRARGCARFLGAGALVLSLGAAAALGIAWHIGTTYEAPLPAFDAAELKAREEALLAGIPDGSTRARMSTRREGARAESLLAKARTLERRILTEERARPFFLLPIRYEAGKPIETGEVETTAHYLAALAFRHRVTGEADAVTTARKVLDGLAAMDEANGADGYLPKTVRVKGSALEVVDDETHANVYAQLFFAFVHCHRAFTDAGVRARLRTLADRITGKLLAHDFVVTDGKGVPQPHGDISPRRFRIERARALGGLLATQAGISILGEGQRVADLKALRDRMLGELAYGSQIQALTFKLHRFHWPTPSSTWLNLQKLSALLALAPEDPVYRSALHRTWGAVRETMNPFFAAVALAGLPDLPPAERARARAQAEYYLGTFPPTWGEEPVDLTGHPGIPKREPSRTVKARWKVEAHPPLPLFMRARNGHEWKRLQGRIQGGRPGAGRAPATDYLLAYWMLRDSAGR